MNFTKFSLCLLFVLCLVMTVSADPPNLVINGNFDTDSVSGGSQQVLYSGLTGWTITNSIDLIGTLWDAHSPPNSIDLAGLYQEGTITQNIDTDSTKSYDLSFWMAGNPEGPTRYKIVAVYWGGTEVTGSPFTFDSFGTWYDNMGWRKQSISNLPGGSGDTTELKFEDITYPLNPGWGTALDDIVVTEHETTVPEFPSAFLPATMIIGFLGAVLLIQRTREH